MKHLGWLDPDRDDRSSGPAPSRFDDSGLLDSARARLAGGPAIFRGDVAEALLEWNRQRGASDLALEKAESVARGDGLVVLTGQQPALWGGPLYSLYKLLTTVALAARLERTLGTVVLPVFWIVGDDADFGEVSSTWLPPRGAKPVKQRDPDPPSGGVRIGPLDAKRQLAVLESARGAFATQPHGELLYQVVSEAIARGRTWSGTQAALFHHLLPDLPFFCIDGDDPALLGSAREWLASAGRNWPVRDLLRQGAAESMDAGFDPVFDVDSETDSPIADRLLFRIEEDRREPLSGALPEDGLLSPNVILRPLLQDWLLPNVSTVVGPSEIAYRAQLGPLYRHAEIPEPILVPRMKAILVPRLSSETLGGDDDPKRYAELVVDPSGWIERRAESALPADLGRAIEDLRNDVEVRLRGLSPQLESFDPSLVQIVESARGKIEFQFARMIDGLRGKARHRWVQSDPGLPGLAEFLRPRGREQERVLSLLTPFLIEGLGAGKALAAEAGTALDRIEPGASEAPTMILVLEEVLKQDATRLGQVPTEGGTAR